VLPCLLIQGRRGGEVRSFDQNGFPGKPRPTEQPEPLWEPGLPAIAVYQVPTISTDTPSSRASPLPQGGVCYQGMVSPR